MRTCTYNFEKNGKKFKICIDKMGTKIYSYFRLNKYYYKM